MVKKIIFKDIIFSNIQDHQIVKFFKKKSLFVFPSGPNLSELKFNSKYYMSLKKADYVFFDSGFFVLLLKFNLSNNTTRIIIDIKSISTIQFPNSFADKLSDSTSPPVTE